MRIYNLAKISTNYRPSERVHGYLEIPANVPMTMPGSVKNHLLINKYKEIVTDNYAETKNKFWARF